MEILKSFRTSWEACLQYRDWRFQISDIKIPILLFHGTDDHFAPIEFARYKREQFKKSIYYEYSDQGHLYMLTIFDEIFKKM